MIVRSPVKSDLVIAMTLAETFLLLIFVVWYGEVVSGRTGEQPDWRAVAERCQAEMGRLERELEQQKLELARLERVVDWWQRNFSAGPPGSLEELITVLRSPEGKPVLQDLARGYPRCEENNVLVRASVRSGIVRMEVVADSRRLREWSNHSGIQVPPVQTVLEDWNSIRYFLNAVSGFYSSTLLKQRACRFDYWLTYVTKEDYYDGRESFEKCFYPAGISQARAGGD